MYVIKDLRQVQDNNVSTFSFYILMGSMSMSLWDCES